MELCLAGPVAEKQGWLLKRCLSFTANRLVNRPNPPKDKILRAYLSDLGYHWPEPVHEEEGGEDGNGEEEEEEEEEGEEGEEEVEEEDEEVHVEPHGHECGEVPKEGNGLEECDGLKDVAAGETGDNKGRGTERLMEDLKPNPLFLPNSGPPSRATSANELKTPPPKPSSPPLLTPEAVVVPSLHNDIF